MPPRRLLQAVYRAHGRPVVAQHIKGARGPRLSLSKRPSRCLSERRAKDKPAHTKNDGAKPDQMASGLVVGSTGWIHVPTRLTLVARTPWDVIAAARRILLPTADASSSPRRRPRRPFPRRRGADRGSSPVRSGNKRGRNITRPIPRMATAPRVRRTRTRRGRRRSSPWWTTMT